MDRKWRFLKVPRWRKVVFSGHPRQDGRKWGCFYHRTKSYAVSSATARHAGHPSKAPSIICRLHLSGILPWMRAIFRGYRRVVTLSLQMQKRLKREVLYWARTLSYTSHRLKARVAGQPLSWFFLTALSTRFRNVLRCSFRMNPQVLGI